MNRLLTDAELALMQVLWASGEATVREVHAALGDGRAYTTVATELNILVDKGFLAVRREGRSFVYAPAVPREAYERTGVGHLVQRLFGGDALALVRALVRPGSVSTSELAEIERLVRAARDGDGR